VVLDVQVRFFGDEGRVGGTLLAALRELDRASGQDGETPEQAAPA
jgi:hypothetical protein